MARHSSRLSALSLLLVATLVAVFFPADTHAELPKLSGYSEISLTSTIESSFLKLIADSTAYASAVSKRLCVLSIDSVSKTPYGNPQLNYIVTACDVKAALTKQGVVATRDAIAEELKFGYCKSDMVVFCKASRVKASIETVEKSSTQISYIMTESI